MALKLKLMYNDPDVFDGLEIVEEQNKLGTGNTLYIQGPYTGTALNKNKRVYPKEELDRDMTRYITEMVNTNRSLGELNHSQNSEVNPERACHIVVKLYEDNDVWFGKSKILTGEGMPCGNLVKGLLNNGVSLGISTRSLGTLEESTGCKIVKNLHIIAFDCVADPSFPKAFVNGILESKTFIIDGGSTYEELYDNFENSLIKLPKKEIDTYLREQIVKFINALG